MYDLLVLIDDGAAARGVIELFQPEREVDSMSTEMTRAHGMLLV